MYRYILFPLPIIGFLLLSGFTSWFAWSAYRVRDHPPARLQFTTLALFSGLAALTFIVACIETSYYSFVSMRAEDMSISTRATFYVLLQCKLVMQCIICLCVLGFAWPRVMTKRKARASFITYINNGDSADNTANNWHNRLRNWIGMKRGRQSSMPNMQNMSQAPLPSSNHEDQHNNTLSEVERPQSEQNSSGLLTPQQFNRIMHFQTYDGYQKQPAQLHSGSVFASTETLGSGSGSHSWITTANTDATQSQDSRDDYTNISKNYSYRTCSATTHQCNHIL
ncbi:hypothetical protein BDF19DRAFT_122289 [Syncephalis fuscata]|nr:hypothetical protein BDF19DRAFT_122289 [Syncephalis fuscata]